MQQSRVDLFARCSNKGWRQSEVSSNIWDQTQFGNKSNSTVDSRKCKSVKYFSHAFFRQESRNVNWKGYIFHCQNFIYPFVKRLWLREDWIGKVVKYDFVCSRWNMVEWWRKMQARVSWGQIQASAASIVTTLPRSPWGPAYLKLLYNCNHHLHHQQQHWNNNSTTLNRFQSW